MAKQQNQHADSASISLAERLFIANWKIVSGINTEHVAEKCIEAAELFDQVRVERETRPRIAKTA